MNKEFIPYEEALALKELGFDIDVEFYKDSDEEIFDMRTPDDAPCILWQQAFRWFREKHDLYVTPNRCVSDRKKWSFDIWNIEGDNIEIDMSNTYEKAELDCLRRLIEIVKER